MSYDKEELANAIKNWACEALQASAVEIAEVVANRQDVEIAYSMRWKRHVEGEEINFTALAKSLQQRCGPLIELASIDEKEQRMRVHALQIPKSVSKRIQSNIEGVRKMYEANENYHVRLYVAIFIASVVAFLHGSYWLHEHLHGYEEPWETPLEFIRYHVHEWFGIGGIDDIVLHYGQRGAL